MVGRSAGPTTQENGEPRRSTATIAGMAGAHHTLYSSLVAAARRVRSRARQPTSVYLICTYSLASFGVSLCTTTAISNPSNSFAAM